MKGPSCWQGCVNDQESFKKLMWYEIMKEFNCKVYDSEQEMAFTHR